MKRENVYEKMKNGKSKKITFDKDLLTGDTVKWGGAGIVSALLFGLIDGGLSVAIAFGFNKYIK